MPLYEIEQYELHMMKFHVEANSPAEAIERLFRGELEALDNSMEFVEIADDYGMPADEHRELADKLRELDIYVDEVIPSIRSINEIENPFTDS